MTHFKTIGIFTKPQDDRVKETLTTLVKHLEKHTINYIIDTKGASYLGTDGFSYDEMASQIDLAIIMGGDGTLLHTGRFLAPFDIPILGINLGRVGFLVDVTPDDMTTIIDQVLAGHYIEEKRTLLGAAVYRGDELLGKHDALNDVVFHVRNKVHMVEFTTHINNTFVNTQRADGVVIATPTGSTAYALSSGGPIIHPGLDALALVPICPNTLSHRPIVINASDTIEITLCEGRYNEARISYDGQSQIDIISGDRTVISKKDYAMTLLHPKNHDYYHLLRAKLHWSIQH